MQSLKEKKLEELHKKYQNIRIQRQINHLARQQQEDPEEDQEYIREHVKKEASLIHKAIQDALQITKGYSKDQKEAYIQQHKKQNRQLQEFVASKSFCLPSFLLKQFQTTIDSISSDLTDLKSKLVPKGKFSFKSKITKKKPATDEQLNGVCGGDQQKVKSIYEDDARDYIISNENDKVIYIQADLLSKNDKENIRISNISRSKIVIPTRVKALYVKDIRDCQIFVGAVEGGSHLTKLQNCQVHLATHQLRVHQSTRTSFRVISRSEPIIESCDELIFSPLKIEYAKFTTDLKQAGLYDIKNKYADVQDFKWHKQIQNPHWKLEDEDELKQNINLDKFKI